MGLHKEPASCEHEKLMFGSGAFYVICQGCNQFWVAKNGSDTNIDYSTAAHQVCGQLRVKT